MSTTNLAVSVDMPQINALAAAAQRGLVNAQATIIDSAITYDAAADDLRTISLRIDSIEDLRKSIVKPFQDAVKNANAQFSGPAAIWKSASDTLRTAMLGYSRRQEQIAREAREKAEAAARAEQDRLREEAAAATAKADAEAAELRRKADELAAAGKAAQAAKMAARADSREDAGRSQAIAATIAAQQVVAAAAPVFEPVAAKGVAGTKRFTAEVVDLVALIKHVAEHPELQHYLEANLTALRQFATATRGAAPIPGVRIVQVDGLSVRKR